MEQDLSEWWPEDHQGTSRILRFQVAFSSRAAYLRLEATDPNDPSGSEAGGIQYALTPDECRRLASVLVDAASKLDGSESVVQ